jgi:hypothetical protein
MPEEGIETQELRESLEEEREKVEEARERVEEARERSEDPERTRWLTWLSLSTAIVAVLAAVASLESGGHANEAILLKTNATLTQSAADDAWGYFQAKAIKEEIYTAIAPLAPRPEVAGDWKRRAEAEAAAKGESKAEAEKLAAEVKAADEESKHELHVHHQFAKSVTIFQVAIALAAIAALTRRKPVWWLSLGVGAVGCVFLGLGFMLA